MGKGSKPHRSRKPRRKQQTVQPTQRQDDAVRREPRTTRDSRRAKPIPPSEQVLRQRAARLFGVTADGQALRRFVAMDEELREVLQSPLLGSALGVMFVAGIPRVLEITPPMFQAGQHYASIFRAVYPRATARTPDWGYRTPSDTSTEDAAKRIRKLFSARAVEPLTAELVEPSFRDEVDRERRLHKWSAALAAVGPGAYAQVYAVCVQDGIPPWYDRLRDGARKAMDMKAATALTRGLKAVARLIPLTDA